MDIVFWSALATLLYVYAGYCMLLKLALAGKNLLRPVQARHRFSDTQPAVTVIIAAHDEEAVIKGRIENILASDYPKEKLDVIVASDGSTDGTVAASGDCDKERVHVLDLPRRGRALTHNHAVEEARGEIIVFTDAEGNFDKSFIKEVVACFGDPSVGCVNGNLFFVPRGGGVTSSVNLYWEIEKKVFALESDLGFLAVTSGTCTAVRKRLWKPLSATYDVDFCTTLDVISQGYKVRFASSAFAYDLIHPSTKGEFNSRVRMVAKNFAGTIRRWGLKGFVAHPLVSFGLLSHKLLRWLSPFFFALLFLSNLFLINDGLFWKSAFSAQFLFYVAGLVGGLGEAWKVRLPLASSVFSFLIANLAMALGVLKGLAGRAPAYYN